VPPALLRLEPWAVVALAVHGVGVQVVERDVQPTIAVAVVALALLGGAGLAGWRTALAVAARLMAALALGFGLMALRGAGSGYFLLWWFLLAAVYPPVLPGRLGRWVAVVVPGTYLALLAFDAADGPWPVALVRGVVLAVIAGFAHAAAEAFRRTAAERDDAMAILDTFAETAPVGLGVWAPDLRLVRANETFGRFAGLDPAAPLAAQSPALTDLPARVVRHLGRVVRTGAAVRALDVQAGGRSWTADLFPVRVDDRVIGVGAVTVDVTDQRVAARALTHSATHDPLTGLPNRVLFRDRLEVAAARARRRGEAVAVLFCDVDRFKVVNDSLGHAAGDELLGALGERLARALRPGDTVARLGGDEFAVLCAEVSDERAAVALAERVCAAMREPVVVGGREVVATMSIGVTVGVGDVAQLLQDADVALYEAKDAGRDRVAVFDARLRQGARERFEFHAALRAAVAEGRVVTAYQPRVDLRADDDRRVVGFEALARWTSPAGRPVPPAVFIPTAEELGLILSLGEQVLRRACADVARWRAGSGAELTAAVSLSAHQLADPGLATLVADVLADSGLPPEALELEITESVLMGDLPDAVQQLGRLRDLGVRVAIDDFGTGYSSLAYLRDLPVDVLKIDRSFTARLPADVALLGFVVELARAIGASTVVEGVETEEQLGFVTSVGCDRAQGFLFGRPMDGSAAGLVAVGRPGA
jgi:diguanylate cyclase (GGDEF)-like protein